MISFPTH